ncbi:MAG TPA: Ig-like domain-containing protein, partial [Gemmatimonadales bacterium]|nr:Ig-like domain-containing protein [Gemmatimonadales bacterium]
VVLSTKGDTLNRSVTWSSSAPTAAGVSEAGVVSALAPGSAVVTATSGGTNGTSAITVVSAPPPGVWPHEPSSYRLVADEPWSILSPLKWVLEFGTALITLDPSAPESPPFVLQFTYPTGMAGGVAPGTMEYPLTGQHNLFVGMWWKPSNPWQGHFTGSNKIQYAFTDAHGSITMVMYGPIGGPFELRVFPQFSTSAGIWLTPNVATVPVQLGAWHQIEWQLVYSTDASTANGVCRWWIDGTLVGDYENLVFPPEGLTAYKIAPVWGGIEDVKNETDFYWVDHVHISGN